MLTKLRIPIWCIWHGTEKLLNTTYAISYYHKFKNTWQKCSMKKPGWHGSILGLLFSQKESESWLWSFKKVYLMRNWKWSWATAEGKNQNAIDFSPIFKAINNRIKYPFLSDYWSVNFNEYWFNWNNFGVLFLNYVPLCTIEFNLGLMSSSTFSNGSNSILPKDPRTPNKKVKLIYFLDASNLFIFIISVVTFVHFK